MPKLAPNAVPSYRLHRQSGQAIVTLSGKDYLLGKHGSIASKTDYKRLIAEWLVGGRQCVTAAKNDLTVAELILAFWAHATEYYRNADGSSSGELDNFRCALIPLRDLYACTQAGDFGPLALKAVRQAMVSAGGCRNYVNRQIARLKQVFKWAVADELIPASVYHALATVAGLQQGKGGVRESDPVKPAPYAYIRAIKPFVSGQVQTMVELQLLTGMRGGELFIMRTADLDTSGPVWHYRPISHKTAHHGLERIIDLGPRAQELLRPWLKPDLNAFIFSPKEAEMARRSARRSVLPTPVQPSQLNRVMASHSAANRPARDRYDSHSYRRAIARACEKAFPPPAPLAKSDGETLKQYHDRLTPEEQRELRQWRHAHSWHPHQLRHNFGTAIRRKFGLEQARVLLGHTSAAVTTIYAEQDRQVSQKVMEQVG
jgi:integrase